MKPLVSICIPAYNGVRFLEQCIDSVLAQTFADFELLVVDDQSSDDTLSIVKSYAAQDPRVRVLRNEKNLGLVGNWNRCAELARGEWVKFVFQDDMIAPECLARMLSHCQENTALVSCAREFLFEPETSQGVREWYERNERTIEKTWGKQEKISAEQFCQALLERPGANLVGEPTAVLLRRSVFQNFGFFNPHLIMSCDLEYWARVATHTGFVWVPEPLATFRVHSGATSAENRASRGYRMDVLDDLIILHEFVFHSAYGPLRAASARRVPPVDLAGLFLEKARWARNIADGAAKDPARLDASLLQEWAEVVRHYPKISAVAQRHGIWDKLWTAAGLRRRTPLC